jgi:hypothetical protein
MTRFIGLALTVSYTLGLATASRAADEKEAKAVFDKAIKAMGGEEKLAKVKAATWKSKGTITFGDQGNEFTSETTVQGIDHLRNEFEGEFGGNKFKGVTVLAGDKGWRDFGGNASEMDKDALANEKRNAYLQSVPIMLLPLKEKDFKIESAKEEKVNDKAAAVIKVTGPDGKDFTLYFDKESGLPVKSVAKVIDFMGDEFTQDTTYADYKEFGGVKRATKIMSTRNGEKFLDLVISDFKVLDKVDAKTFTEPK